MITSIHQDQIQNLEHNLNKLAKKIESYLKKKSKDFGKTKLILGFLLGKIIIFKHKPYYGC